MARAAAVPSRVTALPACQNPRRRALFRDKDERKLMHGLECDDVPAIRLYRGSLLSRLIIGERAIEVGVDALVR
jgi:hypothetical protein